MRMQDISKESRPRERLLHHGPSVLSDAELLAVIFQRGIKGHSIIEMCNSMLKECTLHDLAAASYTELIAINGIGPAKALQLRAAFELATRAKTDAIHLIRSSRDVYAAVQNLFPKDKEAFMVICLNTKNHITKKKIISIGTLSSSIVHPRDVYNVAIKEAAHAIIAVHNHPSGDPSPSEEDKHITTLLTKTGKIVGIPLLDHIIIGRSHWYSFKEGEGI